ncbi:MAG: hypothetical protein AB1342_16965 [Pseudomonadota bacterium]
MAAANWLRMSEQYEDLVRLRERYLREIEAFTILADSSADPEIADKVRKAIDGTFEMLNVVDARIAAFGSEPVCGNP